jgi:hypothetical protein
MSEAERLAAALEAVDGALAAEVLELFAARARHRLSRNGTGRPPLLAHERRGLYEVITRLWAEDLTVPQIAQQLSFSRSRIEGFIRDIRRWDPAALPHRRPGPHSH